MATLRFFTDEKFQANLAHVQFAEYWCEHEAQFPPALKRLNGGMLPIAFYGPDEDPIFLHDARLQSFSNTHDQLELNVQADHNGSPRDIQIIYKGVTSLPRIDVALLNDAPTSDLVLHETTVADDGTFFHVILFARGDIISIGFTDVELHVRDNQLA